MARIRGFYPVGEKRTTALAIYQALTEIASEQHTPEQAEAPVRLLCDYAGVSESTAKRYLREFDEQLGIIRKEARTASGVQLPNRYLLTTPGSSSAPTEPAEPPGSTHEPTPGSTHEPTPSVESDPPNTPLGEKENNNKPVVAALTDFGVSKGTAEALDQRFDHDYVWEKIDQATYLLERKSPLVAKNPAGYLRRAIEDDYRPPNDYVKAQARLMAPPDLQELTVYEDNEEVKRRPHQEKREAVLQASGSEEAETSWVATTAFLRQFISPLAMLLLRDAVLIIGSGEAARVVVPTKYAAERAQKKLAENVAEALSQTMGRPYRVSFTDYDTFLASVSADQPAAS